MIFENHEVPNTWNTEVLGFPPKPIDSIDGLIQAFDFYFCALRSGADWNNLTRPESQWATALLDSVQHQALELGITVPPTGQLMNMELIQQLLDTKKLLMRSVQKGQPLDEEDDVASKSGHDDIENASLKKSANQSGFRVSDSKAPSEIQHQSIASTEDGPFGLDGFRLEGIEIKGLSQHQKRLLELLHQANHMTLSVQDLCGPGNVWPDEIVIEGKAVGTMRTRVNNVLKSFNSLYRIKTANSLLKVSLVRTDAPAEPLRT